MEDRLFVAQLENCIAELTYLEQRALSEVSTALSEHFDLRCAQRVWLDPRIAARHEQRARW